MTTDTDKHLPPELIEAILPFLPAKSLGRFKSVSKPWCSLISSPQFVKTHILHTTKYNPNPSPTKLILDNGYYYFYLLHAPPVLWKKILGSRNGLVLATDHSETILLSNPTTRTLLRIRDPPYPDDEKFVSYGYGFGYDSSTDDYKVVAISVLDTPNPGCLFVNVYSLRNYSWRKLTHSSLLYEYDGCEGVLINENLHWLLYEYDGCEGVLINENLHWLVTSTRSGHPTRILVSFSLTSEEFNEIELPDCVGDFGCDYKLVALGRKLGIYGNELWVMEEYRVGKSWIKVCSIGSNIDSSHTYCFVEGGKRDNIVLGNEESFVVYNMDTRRCKNVRVNGGRFEFLVSGTYAESLESLERFHYGNVWLM